MRISKAQLFLRKAQNCPHSAFSASDVAESGCSLSAQLGKENGNSRKYTQFRVLSPERAKGTRSTGEIDQKHSNAEYFRLCKEPKLL